MEFYKEYLKCTLFHSGSKQIEGKNKIKSVRRPNNGWPISCQLKLLGIMVTQETQHDITAGVP